MQGRIIRFFILLAVLLAPMRGQAGGREEVALEAAAWGTLRGTLWLPDAPTETALLWVAGSGPTDRYGNSPQGLRTEAYALAAEALSQAGYAVLSYDKRGIGASYYLNREEMLSDCRFENYVEDARRWVDYLRARGYRRVVIVGHSEGSLIALLVAQEAGVVDALISLCGAAMPIDQILKMQLGAQLLTQNYALYAAACRIIDTLKRGDEPTAIPAALGSLFPAYLNRFYWEQMRHDPCQLVRQVACPVLVIGGEYDGQVPAAQAHALMQARPDAAGCIVARMCHVLKRAEGPSVSEQTALYMQPEEPLAEGLVEAMTDFLSRLTDCE